MIIAVAIAGVLWQLLLLAKLSWYIDAEPRDGEKEDYSSRIDFHRDSAVS
ncbi:hypothetical protein TUN199_07968 [Pyrenophora tritici-repentis]|uniref:Uncharacterized protein n=1 Tax=Pyrenophora tritici-repentis TaxID=45151 RepID=A0A834SBM1_9PLEO|nr:hypothetical protein PtrM4_037310 [Pyrenophora tritici-repentis]KAI0574203.1 hypothetical protein Alg215_08722 [Pyrenophora tritici-repentis]KAI0620034.1 hypothetical protein TUN199_07968 [Pyrenophora tritici-repentis]